MRDLKTGITVRYLGGQAGNACIVDSNICAFYGSAPTITPRFDGKCTGFLF
jgi:hypothetical protein